jgi:hypothetical protein
VIAGLNQILDLAFAEYRSQGGTWIVPSHGRLADTADVVDLEAPPGFEPGMEVLQISRGFLSC